MAIDNKFIQSESFKGCFVSIGNVIADVENIVKKVKLSGIVLDANFIQFVCA